MAPADIGVGPRVGLLASMYVAVVAVAHMYGQGLAAWFVVSLLAALYGFLAPLPSTLALAASCYVVGVPLVPLILGAGLGTVAAALLGRASPMEIRAPRAPLRKASLVLSGAALVLSLAGPMGGFPGLNTRVFFVGLAVSLAVSMLSGEERAWSWIQGALAGLSWYGLPVNTALVFAWGVVPEPFRRGIVLGRLAACARRCRRGLGKHVVLCWRSVPSGVLRIDPFAYRNPHILILGMSGSGKTTLSKNIAVGMARKGVGVLILDFHGEYSDLGEAGFTMIDASAAPLNLLDLEGSSPREKASEVADIIQQVFGLGNLQRVVLEQVIEEAYEARGIYQHDPSTWRSEPPTLLNVSLILREHMEAASGLAERSRLAGIAMYLDLLSRTFYQQTSLSPSSLIGGRVVVKLDKLPGEHVKSLYVETLLRRLALTMYRGGLPGPQIVVVEEAHRLASRRRSRRSTLARLLVESRKYGLGFTIVTQQPLDLDEAILANTWLKFILAMQEPRNIDYTVRMMGLQEKSLGVTIKELGIGEAIVEAGGHICRAQITPTYQS